MGLRSERERVPSLPGTALLRRARNGGWLGGSLGAASLLMLWALPSSAVAEQVGDIGSVGGGHGRCLIEGQPRARASLGAGDESSGTFMFDGSLSSDPNGLPIEYHWSFGDGTSTGWQASSLAQHTYGTAGDFCASLWVKNTSGMISAAALVDVTVGDRDCFSDADCDDGLYCNGVETCSASGVCLPGTAVNCDDGVACTTDSCNEVTELCVNVPDDVYCDNGLFCDGTEVCDAVQNCVSTGDPCTTGFCNEATDTCDAGGDVLFTFTPNLAGVGQAVQFTSTVPAGDALAYYWGFGDGGTTTGNPATHSFATTGTYTVSLMVLTTDGQALTDDQPVVVEYDPPMAFVGKLGDDIGFSAGVAVVGDVAWVAGTDGTLVTVRVDPLDDITPLQVLDSATLGGTPYDVLASGGYVYVSSGQAGLYVFNAAAGADAVQGNLDPMGPFDIGVNAKGLAIVGDKLYVSCSAGLRVLDITTNPAAPDVLGDIIDIGPSNMHMVAVGDWLYIATGLPPGLKVFDTAANPVEPGWPNVGFIVTAHTPIRISAAPRANGTTLLGVVERLNGTGQLALFEVSDADPIPIVAVSRIGQVYDQFGTVVLSGDTAYATNASTLQRIDISDPENPVVEDYLSIQGTAGDLAAANGLIYAGLLRATLAVATH